MTVISIREDNHGFIGVAKDVRTAIEWLIDEAWITPHFEISDYKILRDFFGSNWAEQLMAMPLNEFNALFDGSFRLTKEKVIGS